MLPSPHLAHSGSMSLKKVGTSFIMGKKKELQQMDWIGLTALQKRNVCNNQLSSGKSVIIDYYQKKMDIINCHCM